MEVRTPAADRGGRSQRRVPPLLPCSRPRDPAIPLGRRVSGFVRPQFPGTLDQGLPGIRHKPRCRDRRTGQGENARRLPRVPERQPSRPHAPLRRPDEEPLAPEDRADGGRRPCAGARPRTRRYRLVQPLHDPDDLRQASAPRGRVSLLPGQRPRARLVRLGFQHALLEAAAPARRKSLPRGADRLRPRGYLSHDQGDHRCPQGQRRRPDDQQRLRRLGVRRGAARRLRLPAVRARPRSTLPPGTGPRSSPCRHSRPSRLHATRLSFRRRSRCPRLALPESRRPATRKRSQALCSRLPTSCSRIFDATPSNTCSGTVRRRASPRGWPRPLPSARALTGPPLARTHDASCPRRLVQVGRFFVSATAREAPRRGWSTSN